MGEAKPYTVAELEAIYAKAKTGTNAMRRLQWVRVVATAERDQARAEIERLRKLLTLALADLEDYQFDLAGEQAAVTGRTILDIQAALAPPASGEAGISREEE